MVKQSTARNEEKYAGVPYQGEWFKDIYHLIRGVLNHLSLLINWWEKALEQLYNSFEIFWWRADGEWRLWKYAWGSTDGKSSTISIGASFGKLAMSTSIGASFSKSVVSASISYDGSMTSNVSTGTSSSRPTSSIGRTGGYVAVERAIRETTDGLLIGQYCCSP